MAPSTSPVVDNTRGIQKFIAEAFALMQTTVQGSWPCVVAIQVAAPRVGSLVVGSKGSVALGV